MRVSCTWYPVTTRAGFNINMSSYQYRKSHCGDKTVVRSSYLHNGIFYTGKIASWYWPKPEGPDSILIFHQYKKSHCGDNTVLKSPCYYIMFPLWVFLLKFIIWWTMRLQYKIGIFQFKVWIDIKWIHKTFLIIAEHWFKWWPCNIYS